MVAAISVAGQHACSASPPPGASPSSIFPASTCCHTDRPAVLGVAGHRRPGLRAAVRRPRLVRAWLSPITGSRSSSRCRASSSRRSSSPSRSSPRQLIPLMRAAGHRRGRGGADCSAPRGCRSFCRVTLPNIKWALLYGVLLCNARAMGEFGAVSVVSGRIRGETMTMPLHVEILYNEYNLAGAFAVAALLVLLALVTLVAKAVVEWRHGSELAGEQPVWRAMTLRVSHLSKHYGSEDRSRRHRPRCRRRRVSRVARSVRRRKDDAAAADRRARPAGWRLGRSSTASDIRTVSPRDRRIGFVFQNYALFRHMSVARNIAFGLTVKPRRERPSRARNRGTGRRNCSI